MAETRASGPKKALDPFGIAGCIVGMGAILFAYVVGEKGSIAALLLWPPMLVVFGGTFGALCAAFPLHVFMSLPKVFQKSISSEVEDPLEAVRTFVRLADKARREGLLSLEDEAASIHDDFMKSGIQEVVDGTPPEQISELLEIRIAEMEARHKDRYSMFEQAAGFAPTMGIIGTVLSLVVVLTGLGDSDSAALGHAISSAFIATLFGVATANLFWGPLGQRLKRKSEEEVAHMRMIVEGILAIQAGDAPRLVRTKLEGFLSPADRARSKQAAEGGAGGLEPAAAGAR